MLVIANIGLYQVLKFETHLNEAPSVSRKRSQDMMPQKLQLGLVLSQVDCLSHEIHSSFPEIKKNYTKVESVKAGSLGERAGVLANDILLLCTGDESKDKTVLPWQLCTLPEFKDARTKALKAGKLFVFCVARKAPFLMCRGRTERIVQRQISHPQADGEDQSTTVAASNINRKTPGKRKHEQKDMSAPQVSSPLEHQPEKKSRYESTTELEQEHRDNGDTMWSRLTANIRSSLGANTFVQKLVGKKQPAQTPIKTTKRANTKNNKQITCKVDDEDSDNDVDEFSVEREKDFDNKRANTKNNKQTTWKVEDEDSDSDGDEFSVESEEDSSVDDDDKKEDNPSSNNKPPAYAYYNKKNEQRQLSEFELLVEQKKARNRERLVQLGLLVRSDGDGETSFLGQSTKNTSAEQRNEPPQRHKSSRQVVVVEPSSRTLRVREKKCYTDPADNEFDHLE